MLFLIQLWLWIVFIVGVCGESLWKKCDHNEDDNGDNDSESKLEGWFNVEKNNGVVFLRKNMKENMSERFGFLGL